LLVWRTTAQGAGHEFMHELAKLYRMLPILGLAIIA
jgi:hypothetical protein